MKPAIKKIQPVKVVTPFIDEQSESITPLNILVDEEKISDLYFSKGVARQVNKPYLNISNYTFKQQVFNECQLESA